jgi:hypothetical protein
MRGTSVTLPSEGYLMYRGQSEAGGLKDGGIQSPRWRDKDSIQQNKYVRVCWQTPAEVSTDGRAAIRGMALPLRRCQNRMRNDCSIH